jgi:sulfate adenylyltransferase subunit 1
VAYRYFATPARKFIIADTPGHEQYTRNMVTGASTADAALLLIDPTRVVNGQLLPQTKRHAALAKLLGTRHIIAVVNKMDLVDYSQSKYDEIVGLLGALSASLDLSKLTVIPVSALQGDNVVNLSDKTPWYSGEPLLTLLEQLPVANQDEVTQALRLPLRFTVQYVIRTDGSKADDFRGFAGFVASGAIAVGDAITVQPSGASAVVARLHTYDGDLQTAHAGQAITVVLDRDVDVSRGDTIVAANDATAPIKSFNADLCWMDSTTLNPARKYWLKIGAKTTYAKVNAITSVLDIASLNYGEPTAALGLNGIGIANITLQNSVLADDYCSNRATGAFVLIDTASHQTVAAGMVRSV